MVSEIDSVFGESGNSNLLKHAYPNKQKKKTTILMHCFSCNRLNVGPYGFGDSKRS